MGKDAAEAPAASLVNYDALESQRQLEMQRALRSRMEQLRKDEVARQSNLRHVVLGAVVGEQYERAREELKAYLDSRPHYPELQERGGRYLKHCLDLIQAIETKRNFPGLTGLSLPKQQDMHERVIQHFNELKHFLSRMEKLEVEQKIKDVRSTAWFLQKVTQIGGAVLVFAFFLDLQRGIFSSATRVFNSAVGDLVNKIAGLLNF